jgi:transposase
VATPPTAACPLCQQPFGWVHSRYQRTVADLPLGGTDVVLRIRARKFFCRVPGRVKCPYSESGTLARLCRVETRA